MKYNDLITPVGTRDYLFVETELKNRIRTNLHKIFQKSGFKEIETPGIEFYDVFAQNSNYFPQEKLYKFTDNRNRLLVLRPDSTVPIARVVSTRLKNHLLPLRLYYNQYVFRNVPELKGRSVQTEQMGIEMIGSSSQMSDLEVLSTAIEALSSCCDSFIIEIGHAGIFSELISMLDANEREKERIRAYIDEKNLPMLNEYLSHFGSSPVIDALRALPELFGSGEVFKKAERLISIPKVTSIINELKNTYEKLSELVPEEELAVDLGMAHKIDYYTGIMVKGYLDGYGKEVLSGGRYDKLLSEFDYDIPAVGFAVNIDAVAKVKSKEADFHEQKTDVILHCVDGFELKTIRQAQELRKEGYVTEISVFDDRQLTLDYAKENGISKVVIVDENIENIDNTDKTEASEK